MLPGGCRPRVPRALGVLVHLTSGAERRVLGLAWVLLSPVHWPPGDPDKAWTLRAGRLPWLLPAQLSPPGSFPRELLCVLGLLSTRLPREQAAHPGPGGPGQARQRAVCGHGLFVLEGGLRSGLKRQQA